MKEFIEKLIGRLEEESFDCIVAKDYLPQVVELDCIKKIVNQLAEEHKPSMTNGGCVDCDECEHRSEDCLCDISENEEECPLVSNNGWITCENELPKENGYYLVTYKKNGNILVDTWYFNGRNFNQVDEIDVIAWRPLPAPYNPK